MIRWHPCKFAFIYAQRRREMNLRDTGIRDNNRQGTVGDYLMETIGSDSQISIVSAYFTIYAYECLKGKLDHISNLRFLFGEPTYLDEINPRSAKMEFSIIDNTIRLPISKRLSQHRIARECAHWIREKVEVRSMVKPDFLHGKMYHIAEANGTEHAIMGSSNFTKSGLGFGPNPNIELNLILNDRRDIAGLKNWFNEVWESDLSEDKKEYVLQILEKIYSNNSPQFIYYKTLYHLFETFLTEEKSSGFLDERTGYFDTGIWNALYDFQREGVRAAINKILKYNGCIIADSVGLGKTFEALAIIKYFELKNENVLVLCPKKLRQNWTIYKEISDINPFIKDRFSYTVLSHTDLTRKSGIVGDQDLSRINWGNFDLIVIDESHNFRNAGSVRYDSEDNPILNRYASLMENVIKSGVQTKVCLLSATPVNNYLRDLRNQIYIITGDSDDALKEDVGIESIAQTIKTAQAQFTEWTKSKQRNISTSSAQLLERLDSSFFKLLDTLTIARSRKHIENFYDLSAIGSFPERKSPKNVYSNIDTEDSFPSYDVLNKQISKYRLSLYQPSKYLLPEYLESDLEVLKRGEFNQIKRENLLIDMMKVNFLKRLESSVESFEITLERTINKIDLLIDKIDRFNEIFDGYEHLDIEDYINQSEMEADEEIDSDFEEWKTGKKFEYSLNHLDLDTWHQDLTADREQLYKLWKHATQVTPDRDLKLKELKAIIKNKIQNPENSLTSLGDDNSMISNKKILIFTAYADTANYLYTQLYDFVVQGLNLDIGMVSGGNHSNKSSFPKNKNAFRRQTEFDSILSNFSPRSKKRNLMKSMPQTGEIDILIATDCVSEGQNLQDCDYIINYDIHWNPVRIIQRFGRIDRIGSQNKSVQLVNFWPTKDLDQYINLKTRVEARMALVDLTATADDNMLEHNGIQELYSDELTYREKQLKRLKEEVLDLEEMDEQISFTDFSLDDFRAELSGFLKENEKQLQNAPLGMYALVPSPNNARFQDSQVDIFDRINEDIIKPGVIFCLRHIKDHRSSASVNPLHPYYLVYIYENGSVRFNYTSAKRILEIYRSLCKGQNEAIAELCDAFNQETNSGIDMDSYSSLFTKTIDRIKAIFNSRNQAQLFKRGGRMVPNSFTIENGNEFELLTWLIIK